MSSPTSVESDRRSTEHTATADAPAARRRHRAIYGPSTQSSRNRRTPALGLRFDRPWTATASGPRYDTRPRYRQILHRPHRSATAQKASGIPTPHPLRPSCVRHRTSASIGTEQSFLTLQNQSPQRVTVAPSFAHTPTTPRTPSVAPASQKTHGPLQPPPPPRPRTQAQMIPRFSIRPRGRRSHSWLLSSEEGGVHKRGAVSVSRRRAGRREARKSDVSAGQDSSLVVWSTASHTRLRFNGTVRGVEPR